jgi:murein DD-endopeptidase MepM/ murein hydrolase activator NlpD
LLVLAVGTRDASAQEGERGPIYVVLEGDTLIAIASRFGTTVAALVEANGIVDPSSIQPGMELFIPGFEGVSGVLTIHEVAFGESAAALAMAYHLPLASFEKLNRLVIPGRLYVGQAAVVPEPVSGSPANARTEFLKEGQGLLEAAVLWDTNPWLISGDSASLWKLAEEAVYIAGGEELPRDLPVGLEQVALDPLTLVQGRTAVVHATAAPGTTLSGELAGHALNFVLEDSESGAWAGLQGIHALQPPGLVDFELRLEADGVARSFLQPVRVIDGGYTRETLQVPSETLDPANTVPEDAHIAEIVSVFTTERLWSSIFQFPAAYFETFPSRFGTRRSYNGSAYSYYHTGLDLYGNPKTPVLAPAAGRVVFAGPLAVRGNATYIDHGWGVYTGYLHQSEILVAPGDLVETGDTIGMVGATGRVTGAHLHWEIWVGGVPVDPLEWTERVMP